jgi:hypothetical protein
MLTSIVFISLHVNLSGCTKDKQTEEDCCYDAAFTDEGLDDSGPFYWEDTYPVDSVTDVTGEEVTDDMLSDADLSTQTDISVSQDPEISEQDLTVSDSIQIDGPLDLNSSDDMQIDGTLDLNSADSSTTPSDMDIPSDLTGLVICDDIGWPGLSYELNAAEIVRDPLLGIDFLSTSVSYSGGCETHEFSLCWDGFFMESIPVQARLTLTHVGYEDFCDGWISEDWLFNLSTLKVSYQEGYLTENGTIMISLDGLGGQLEYIF